MDAIFVFGDRIAQDRNGRFYTGTSFSQEIFERYLEHFDHLTLMMRRDPVNPDDTAAFERMNPLTDDRIDVVFLPDIVASVRDYLDPRLRREIRKLLEKEIRSGKAVILRMHSYYSYAAARICVRNRIPYLAEAVGCPWDSLTNHSLKGKLMAPSSAAQMRYSMRHAAWAIYVTDRFLQKRYPTKGKSAAISDVELLPPDEQVLERRLQKIRAMEKEPGRRLRIGTSGSVQVAYKGHRFVFMALAALKQKENCCYEYHLAGGGDDSVLRQMAGKMGIEDLVVFEGVMPHEQIYEWLDSLDLYIQPSQQEGLSRALVEAMSRALPAFASDVGGNPELLEPGCIHRCGSVKDITEELENLTAEQMMAMAKYNYQKAGNFQKSVLQKKRRKVLRAFAKMAEAYVLR